LSGKKPFSGATAQAILSKRFSEPVPSIRESFRDATPEIEAALQRALAKDFNERFPTTIEFARALVASHLSTPDGSLLTSASAGTAKSIAVLPFSSQSGDTENESFADGIAEEIINALSKIKALKVSSRTSSFSFKGKAEDIREIARKLQVGTILEGSVRKSGKRLRITAQLVNAADNSQLWAERYDRELEDVFAIQDEISANIVSALRVVLTEDEKQAIEQVPTSNVEAYEFYLRGRQFFHQHRRRAMEFSVQMFEQAIELDPGYALAHCGVADCCSFLFQYYHASQENLDRALSASKRALELSPHLAEAHASRGLAVSLTGQFDEAEREFQEAMRLDPKSFEAAYFYGRACIAVGRFDDAAKWFERAVTVRPDEFAAQMLLANSYTALGRHDDATRAMRRAYDAARKHLELNPDNPRALYSGALALNGLGEPQKAMDWNHRAERMEPDDPSVLYNIACVYAQLSSPDQAIKALERALDNGFGHWQWIEHDTDFESLRELPAFKALLARKPVETETH
jgi:adenylate cyclase